MRRSRKSTPPNALQRGLQNFQAFAVVFLATLLALPVNAAVVLPDEPLVTGARIPPNVLFVLDNSGSMQDTSLPDTITNVAGLNIKNETFVRNMLYYNPAKTYLPWVDSTGATMVGGTSYNSAYAGVERIPPWDLTTINLQDATKTFYVPKDLTDPASFANVTGYYRYQILTSGVVERSEWYGAGGAQTAPGYPLTGLSGGTGMTMETGYPPITVPPNAVNVTITATNVGTASGASLYYRIGAAPDSANYTNRITNNNSTKTFTITSAGQGNVAGNVLYVGLLGKVAGGFSGASLEVTYLINEDGCGGTSWTNCTLVTPTGRSNADERTNFATWYSYHRSRYKAAKAGAGRAFADISGNFRVGYRNIWNNMPITGSSGGVNWSAHPITRAKPIPVTRNDGLFEDPNGPAGADNNRTAWYQRLYSESGGSSTPLRRALWQSGDYFETDTSGTGPWGPETGTSQYSCRQNFTILTTDGYRNDDSSNNPNYDYTGVGQQVGEQDNVNGPTITGPSGATYTYTAANPFASAHINTLADIAMRYWKNDLRTDPGMINNVATSSADPAFWQHMTTFAISLGAEGTLDSDTDLPAIAAGSKSWPQPMNLNATSIDDLWHASVNGRGSFVLATDPDAFTNALKAALTDIAERTGSSSNVAANTTSIDSDTRVFQANYVSGVWSGQVNAYEIIGNALSATPAWQASSGIPLYASRKVFSHNGSAGTVFPADATPAQLTALTRTTPHPVTGVDNAAYIAGDRSQELANGGNLRNRPHLLGDIVGSSPAYSNFTDTIFVGANDGMLHAFDAATGAERFAYIPGILDWGNLRELSNPEYLHKYFVDGPVVVSSTMQTPGENILVGALGKGGKGLYALDVTVPSLFNASNVKWERAETVSPAGNMGYIQSRPIIARLSDGTPALIVGNGINSVNESAVLLVYNLDTGALIKQIDTGVGVNNGLTAPTGWDSDGNGRVDYVYAGDMHGNVWKFDLRSINPTTWSVSNSGAPLFKAVDSGGNEQPITGGLTVAMHPTTFKPWVFVGTGRFMTTGDLTDHSVQSYYAFADTGTTITRAGMTKRSIIALGTKDGKLIRGFEPSAPLPLGSGGWFVDLMAPPAPGTPEGERVVSEGQVIGSVLVFASVIPTADACQSDGRGYLNAVDAFSGTSTGPSFFDLNGDGSFDDETITDGGVTVPIGSVDLGVGMPTLPGLLRGLAAVSGSGGGTGSVVTRESRNVGRVSWREVIRE